MDHQEDNHFHFIETESLGLALGRLNGNHDVPKEMGLEVREPSFSHRKGQNIRWFIPAEVLLIQRLDLEIIDKQEAQFRVK